MDAPTARRNNRTIDVAQTHSEAVQRRAIFRAVLGRELDLHYAVTAAPLAADGRDESALDSPTGGPGNALVNHLQVRR